MACWRRRNTKWKGCLKMAEISKTHETGISPDPLFSGAGMLLVLLQHLEHTIRLACAFLQINGIDIAVDDILSEEPRKRFETLGSIVGKMKGQMGFKPAFQKRLTEFTKNRNTFIHDYWPRNQVFSIADPVDLVTFQKIESFMKALIGRNYLHDQGIHWSTVRGGRIYCIA